MRQKRLFLAKGVFAILTLALPLPLVAASTYKVVHDFTWAKHLSGNLIFDATGNLYGTTYDGAGSGCFEGHGCGAVWKLARNTSGTWTVSILHVFKDADGANPAAGLVVDAAGNLYGTTFQGGNQSFECVRVDLGCGTVFGSLNWRGPVVS
jgi:hypothetical protein